MSDRRHDAMRHAVALALSGRCNNWWAVSARLRARRYLETDVEWSESQRKWLDQLCREARLATQCQEIAPPRPTRSNLAVIEGGQRMVGPIEGRPRPIRVLGGLLNHRSR
jgi:hypothetical protein